MNREPDLDVEIVDYPAKHLIGLRVRTSIPRSALDCPPLWKQFATRLKDFPDGSRKPVYGLYRMVDHRISFDYWVAIEAERSADIPEDMSVFELPARRYARCLVPDSAMTLSAYNQIYGIWVLGQSEYDIDMRGPCFELCPPQWTPNDAFDLYVPLIPFAKD